jgi:hypothetical protein
MDRKKDCRTQGATHQWEYDNLLSELDISSLRFLSHKYNKDLSYFRNNNNLRDNTNAQLYLEMQQRKKMIDEELQNREMWKCDLETNIDE